LQNAALFDGHGSKGILRFLTGKTDFLPNYASDCSIG